MSSVLPRLIWDSLMFSYISIAVCSRFCRGGDKLGPRLTCGDLESIGQGGYHWEVAIRGLKDLGLAGVVAFDCIACFAAVDRKSHGFCMGWAGWTSAPFMFHGFQPSGLSCGDIFFFFLEP
jgi:hypothetical protein